LFFVCPGSFLKGAWHTQRIVMGFHEAAREKDQRPGFVYALLGVLFPLFICLFFWFSSCGSWCFDGDGMGWDKLEISLFPTPRLRPRRDGVFSLP